MDESWFREIFSLENEEWDEQSAMKKEVLDFHAGFCKTFSNSKRLEILCLLKNGEMAVSDIISKLGIPKANVSQHLSLMRMIGILEHRRNGINIYYRMANRKILQGCSLMQNALEQLMDGVALISKQNLTATKRGGKYSDKDN